MSVITDAMLFPGLNEYGEEWADVLEHITWEYDGRSTSWREVDLADIEDQTGKTLTGGNKVFTLTFWAGSFNYLLPDLLVERVRSAPWKYPNEWLLVVDYEHFDSVAVYWHDGGRVPHA